MIKTERLELVPASTETISSSLDNLRLLARQLDATIPKSWPPELLDRAALEWTQRWLQDTDNDPKWGLSWIVLSEPRTLVGVAGYKGGPVDGTVEVGYGVVSNFQRRGFATEATRALVQQAFASPGVERVIAETLPSLKPSIGVLEKCGFRFIGDGSEAGVIRYEINRASSAPSAP